jgi:hypothetical protein
MIKEHSSSCRKWWNHYLASSNDTSEKTLDSGYVLRTLRNDVNSTLYTNDTYVVSNSEQLFIFTG